MLCIYSQDEIKNLDKEFIWNVEPRFRSFYKEFIDAPYLTQILKEVDGANYLGGEFLEDKYGKLGILKYVSTGCKAVILSCYYGDSKIVNFSECGDNALNCAHNLDIECHVYLNRSISELNSFVYYKEELSNKCDTMNIIYKDRNIELDFEIHNSITLIGGDSNTGKSRLYDYLMAVIQIFKNNPYKPVEVECNQDMNMFRFINYENRELLKYLLNDGNKYIYIIDRGVLFIDKEMVNLINNSGSIFIIFSPPIDGLKCDSTSYCELKSKKKDNKVYFINKSVSPRRDGKDFN